MARGMDPRWQSPLQFPSPKLGDRPCDCFNMAEMETEVMVRDISHWEGRRVRRWRLDEGAAEVGLIRGAFFHGTVTGPANDASMLVTVTYDADDSQEELDALALSNCIVPAGTELPQQTAVPPAGPAPPSEHKAAAKKAARISMGGTPSPTRKTAADGERTPKSAGAKRKSTEPQTQPSPRRDDIAAGTPKSAGAKRKSTEPQTEPQASPRVDNNAVTPKRGPGRPSLSPTKKYRGTTQEASGLWRAQITIAGKNHSLTGFKTEEEAALAFNRLAQEHGRKEGLNVVPNAEAYALPEEDEDFPSLPHADDFAPPEPKRRAMAVPARVPEPAAPRASWLRWCSIM